jgi:hypothetical protein
MVKAPIIPNCEDITARVLLVGLLLGIVIVGLLLLLLGIVIVVLVSHRGCNTDMAIMGATMFVGAITK